MLFEGASDKDGGLGDFKGGDVVFAEFVVVLVLHVLVHFFFEGLELFEAGFAGGGLYNFLFEH